MTLSKRTLKLASLALVAGLLGASIAEARGMGGGGGGGARGGGRGSFGGGARGGTRGGARGPGQPAGRYGGAKNDNSEAAMKELEDRVALIADRRKRLADSEREINQEARLAAGRLETAIVRSGEDVR
jgi:hypothetical protein